VALFLWLFALTVRATVVLSAALVLDALLGRGRAAARHHLLTAAAVGLLALPILPALLPAWELPLPAPATVAPEPVEPSVARPAATVAASEVATTTGTEAEPSTGSVHSAPPAVSIPRPLLSSVGAAVAAVWIAGVLASLFGLGRALLSERRLLARARPLGEPWASALAAVQRAVAGSARVRLLVSDEVDTPVTAGWPRAVVLVPAAAEEWDADRRQVVLQHELLHVVRADALRHLAWRLAIALHWFHPLVRGAERRARLVAEQACDAAVVGLGARPSGYARHLLEIAESLRREPTGLATALPMVEQSPLERRLEMILDSHRARGGRGAAAAVVVLLAGVVVAAAAASRAPVAAAPVSAASVAADPLGAAAAPAMPETTCMDGIDGHFGGSYTEGIDDDARGDFTLQHHLGDGRRLCARVRGGVRFDARDGSIRDLPKGASVLVETRGRDRSERMLVTAEADGPLYQWSRNGAAQAVDDAARAWLKDALEAVAGFREIGSIQGEVGSLQGEIGSIQGRIGALQGKIGSLQGEEGSLQGKVGAIQGEQGGLEGEIGGHEGAIGGLEAKRWRADEAELARIDRQIEDHRKAIRKLEEELKTGSLPQRLSQAEADLRDFQKSGGERIAAVQRQIAAIEAEDGIGRLERQIEDLHADARIAEIERRMKPALGRLKAGLP
jgi:beta-lactamase regulating signal transducer with metallopeptidase domain/predicted  nucleic acid-binding Zn-ribbon protein